MNRTQVMFLVVVGAGAAILGVLTAPLFAPDAPPDPVGSAPAAQPALAAPAGPLITRTTPIPRPERPTRSDAPDAPNGGSAGLTGAPAAPTAANAADPANDPANGAAPLTAADGEADGDTGGVFGKVDPSRPFTPDEIKATVATFQDDIADCLSEWGPQIDGFTGRVVLQADFEPEGLQDVRIADLDNVPLQLLGCFSTPVWEATWPQPDGAVTISYPFTVEVDGALEP